MKPKQRWLIIGSLLLATLAGAYLVEDEPLPETGKKKAKPAKQISTPLAGKDQQKGEPLAGSFSFPAFIISLKIGSQFSFSVNIMMTSLDDSICMFKNFFASLSPVPRPYKIVAPRAPAFFALSTI